MAKEINKKIVEATREILKEFGHDVKVGHIYEMYSRLSGYKSWNVASSKEVSFLKNTFEKEEIDSDKIDISFDLKKYEEKLQKGDFKEVMTYGKNIQTNEYLSVDPVVNPGALYAGSMGSGKTMAMRFSLLTHLLANSEDTLYILFDPLKGMSDFKMFFGLKKNVIHQINDHSKIVPIIDRLHEEMMKRKDEFARLNVNSIFEYDKVKQKNILKAKKKLTRIILALEEFHSIPNSEYLNFSKNCNTPGTTAAKFKEIMRVGRSYGITMIVATARATTDDFPSQLKPGITQMMAFRVNNPNDVSALNLPQVKDIPARKPGLCVSTDGALFFPYIPDELVSALIDRYYKELNLNMLTINDLKDFLK